ncbi:MAG: hypothetical protein ACTMII_03365 [Brachybacterium sp.]|uniref:hypothetical protein n=1 Tax=unclassified Brachybacterium TaxID=2623841 RepID=UPI003FDB304D
MRRAEGGFCSAVGVGAEGGTGALDAEDLGFAELAEDAEDAEFAELADSAELADPPSQVRLGFGEPKAASRFLRASSAGSGVEGARRVGCWCLPDRRRLRREAEDGSVMRYILGA